MNKKLNEYFLQHQQELMNIIISVNSNLYFDDIIHLPKITIAKYKYKYFQIRGIVEITILRFRHSYASLLINSCATMNVVTKI